MRKQVLRTVLATATAFSIAVMPALTVCAEDLDVNPEGETISIIDETESLQINNGDVTENNGKIEKNNGNVETNSGEIGINYGKIETNEKDGVVEINRLRGIVQENEGTVEHNEGLIEINNGYVEENHGEIKANEGIVVNNYNSAVVNEGNKPLHQWWSVSQYSHIPMWYTTKYEGDFDDHEIEDSVEATGILRITPDKGYTVTYGDPIDELPNTFKYTIKQDGDDCLLYVTSVTGTTTIYIDDLGIIIDAIKQGDIEPIGPAGGGTASGGTVTVVVDDSITVVPSEGGSQSSDSSSSEALSGAITISLPSTTASTAVATAGPAVLGASREAARAATLKMAKLTDAQYKDAVIKNISDTPAGGLFRLETDRIGTFDRAMLEAFAKRGNVDMEVLFPLGSKKISITIPAGYDINKLLDNKGYCGFLRLLALLGGEVVAE